VGTDVSEEQNCPSRNPDCAGSVYLGDPYNDTQDDGFPSSRPQYGLHTKSHFSYSPQLCAPFVLDYAGSVITFVLVPKRAYN